MHRTIVFTDLDGTLLEEDGRLSPEARRALDELRRRGVPVVPLTSKTRRELEGWLALLDAGRAGAFENGAGILFEGEYEILPGAVAARDLRAVLDALRRETGLPLFSFDEIPDDELANLTGLPPSDATAARDREYDVPFVAPVDAAARLGGARLPESVTAGAGRALLASLRTARQGGGHAGARGTPRRGTTFGLGDAPNDAGFLNAADDAVLIPRASGVDDTLATLVPGALVAPEPSGAGWAAAVKRFVLNGEERA